MNLLDELHLLKGDSPDLSKEEVEGATSTESTEDFISKATELEGDPKAFSLKRHSGILYCVITCKGVRIKVFKLGWLVDD
jgi:hypothetical protein